MTSQDDDFGPDDQYLDDVELAVSQIEAVRDGRVETTEPSRDGLMWVRKHNHEILATGDVPSPEPENNSVVQRRYFRSLDSALKAWGRFAGTPYKVDVAQDVINEMASLESTSPHEYFFVTSDPSYLAVVMKHSKGSGRVWLRKTTIHSARSVKNSELRSGKKFYEVKLGDYAQKKVGTNSSSSSSRLICKTTGQYVPLSGKCDCGKSSCPYFSE
jgi:hypothetical protein